MKRLGLDLAFARILLIALPWSCGPKTFNEPAPAPYCGAESVVPFDPTMAGMTDGGLADGGATDGGATDGGATDGGMVGRALTPEQCARFCRDSYSCRLEASDGGDLSVRCVTTCYAVGCGRRPAELPALAESGDAEDLDAQLRHYFEQAAYLEAASVHAFRRLGTELVAHSAPQELVQAAARAVEDEVRHTRIMTWLARRHGGKLQRPPRGPRHVRLLGELALENAVEGCVRETYGALVAWVQACAAADPQVAQAFRRIAVEETDHAHLAFAIAEWAHGRLTASELRLLKDAQREAIAALRTEVQREPPPGLAHLIGLPAQAVAEGLLHEAERTLWA